MLLAEGLFERAAEILEEVPELGPPAGEYGEYLLGRAVALACLGDTTRARDLAARGVQHTRALEAQTLAPFVMAISAMQDKESEADELALHACRNAKATGGIDSFVSVYRSWPRVLERAAKAEDLKRWMAAVLRNARDDQIAGHLGLPRIRRNQGIDVLSPREMEVFDLLVQGLTNRQIAKALWISESTAKVHVRHIFEKLGVRSRVEATHKARILADSSYNGESAS
jgi:DNA-binding CsgD family transcriptional regulator